MTTVAAVCQIFAVNRASVPSLIRDVGAPYDAKRPLEGRRFGKWLITWDSIAKLLRVDVAVLAAYAQGHRKLERLVLSVTEVAHLLGVCPDTVIAALSCNPQDLYGFKMAGEWKIPAYAVASFGMSAKDLISGNASDDPEIAS